MEEPENRRSPFAHGDNFHERPRTAARPRNAPARTRSSRAFARPAFLEQTPVMGFCKLEQVIPLTATGSGCVCGRGPRVFVCPALYSQPRNFSGRAEAHDPADHVLGTSRELRAAATPNTVQHSPPLQSLSFIARTFYGAAGEKHR